MSADLLARAIAIAEVSVGHPGRGPFGAVVARGDEILGEGGNRVVTDADPTAHAEIVAIRAAAERLGTHVLDDCVIYCSCEPCPMCLAAIQWARIPRVVFAASREDAAEVGFDDVRFREEAARDWDEREIRHEQREREAGREALRRWAEHPDRREY